MATKNTGVESDIPECMMYDWTPSDRKIKVQHLMIQLAVNYNILGKTLHYRFSTIIYQDHIKLMYKIKAA